MTRMTRPRMFALIALLASAPAWAGSDFAFTGQRIGPVADRRGDEGARFQQDWSRLPAREREAMRRALREQWEELPPEARKHKREELYERMRDMAEPADPRYWGGRDDGYGKGYGSRRDRDRDD
ncbi:MAG: hypothetical protein ACOZB0_08530 [Pseudomonadota bacterium]